MIRLAILLIWTAGAVLAQTPVNLVGTDVRETRGGLDLTLTLDAITPYRVFTLDDPARLVLDLEAAELASLDAAAFRATDLIARVRSGPLRPGWSRMIFDLAGPLALDQAGMSRDGDAVVLRLRLATVSAEDFAARSGAPPDPGWDQATDFDPAAARRQAAREDYLVLIDATHGGSDRGVIVGDIAGADLTLIMAQELAARLNRREGISAALTRQGDDFVTLEARRAAVARTGADLVLVFHAEARGDRGLRVASYRAGAAEVDSRADDVIGTILGELASAETTPQSDRIADALVAGFSRSAVPVARDPRLWVDLPMLRDLGVPAVAVLLGDLDNPEDRAFLAAPEGRNALAEAIAATVDLLAR
ncbi:N-acetylmuramoyl-L-alanine amidase [Yoonia sp.]|uniref:N-acetylmuramoyl-L-alanine amidase n=1 Tax=Yoonia sp. TaxID=2212373 RepID=UPI002FDA2BA0